MSRIVGLTAIKDLPLAKSRLYPPVMSDTMRKNLVLAMLEDTVNALSPLIDNWFITTRDNKIISFATTLGISVVPEPIEHPHNTIAAHNAALRSASNAALEQFPLAQRLFIQPDLPSITNDEVLCLSERLSAMTSGFIADSSAQGTTIVYLSNPNTQFPGLFGPLSALQHKKHGLLDLSESFSGLRHDIDTIEDLRVAVQNHLGPASRKAIENLVLL